jgi:hypothetical protein
VANLANTGGSFESWLGQMDSDSNSMSGAVHQPSAAGQEDLLGRIDLDDDEWMRHQL